MRALVVGGGISGISAALFLRRRGWSVLLSDPKPLNGVDRENLHRNGIDTSDSTQDAQLIGDVDLLVASPGLSPRLPIFVAASASGIPTVSEIDLFKMSFFGTLIGVTGTNGKSTTTALTAHILQKLGYKSIAAGNIGLPACSVVEYSTPESIICLELSSYQLEWSNPIVPDVGVLTSLGEDHLARHGTLENYVRCKLRIFEGIQDPSRMILTKQAVAFLSYLKLTVRDGFTLADEQLLEGMKLWGLQARHDLINATCAVFAVAKITGLPIELVAKQVESFTGLEHRCEIVPTRFAKPLINDSKATNLQSTEAALDSIIAPCTLMLGGSGKGEDFRVLSKYSGKIANLICFGKDGGQIANQCQAFIQPTVFATLATALDYLFTNPENIIGQLVFSPGCASFDEFKNFEHRGAYFKDRAIKAFGKL